MCSPFEHYYKEIQTEGASWLGKVELLIKICL